MAGGDLMLIAHVERYISLRQALGYKLKELARNLHGFAKFATDRGDAHILISTVEDWAAGASSPFVRYIRVRDITRLARFLNAENSKHPIRSTYPFIAVYLIYTRRRRLCSSWQQPGVCANPIRYVARFTPR
jgi:hypothetical protein